MITLWVMEGGLIYNHDPNNPKLSDIKRTTVLANLADRVVLQTANGKFLRKDPDSSDKAWDGKPLDFLSSNDTRVIFDPVYGLKVLECKAQSPNTSDMTNFSKMLVAVRGY